MPNLISLEVNNQTYSNFLSYSIEKDIENLCGTFSLEISASDEFGDLPITPNDAIRVTIDGEPVITGYVDEMTIDYSAESHTISLTGRDKTADFVDSKLDSKTFSPPIGFEELLRKLLRIVGYQVVPIPTRIGLSATSNQISIINNYGPIPQFTTAEGIQLRSSESAYELIKRCAEKRQILVNSDGNGNIVINRIGADIAPTILQNSKSESNNNNIKNGRARFSWQDRFRTYKIKSMTTQGNSSTNILFNNDSTVAPNSDPISTTPQVGTATDPDVRATRIYSAIGSSAMTSADCRKRAEWEANIRKTKGFSYSCEVYGFRQNLNEVIAANPLWKPNQLVYIFDEFADLDNEFLIKSVNYTQDLNKGSITKLELVDKDAYTTSIFEPLLRKRKGKKTSNQILFPV